MKKKNNKEIFMTPCYTSAGKLQSLFEIVREIDGIIGIRFVWTSLKNETNIGKDLSFFMMEKRH